MYYFLAWKKCQHYVVHIVELCALKHTVPKWKELYLQKMCLRKAQRNRIKIETKNNQLFIHYNMPDLENWDLRPTLLACLVI